MFDRKERGRDQPVPGTRLYGLMTAMSSGLLKDRHQSLREIHALFQRARYATPVTKRICRSGIQIHHRCVTPRILESRTHAPGAWCVLLRTARDCIGLKCTRLMNVLPVILLQKIGKDKEDQGKAMTKGTDGLAFQPSAHPSRSGRRRGRQTALSYSSLTSVPGFTLLEMDRPLVLLP